MSPIHLFQPGRRFAGAGLAVFCVLTGPVLCAGPELAPPSSAPQSNALCLVESAEPGWPQWRGPRRDGVSAETGLLERWPAGGPRLVWKVSGLGKGYAAPVVTGGRVVLAGDLGEDEWIFAFDLEGKALWRAAQGRAWKGPYPGARASGVFSQGRFYHLSPHGRLACLQAADGALVWETGILERFGATNIFWALSENLLVDGPRVLVTPGGARALMAALDKTNGRTVWTTPALRLGPSPSPAMRRLETPAGECDPAAYTSPVLFTQGARRFVVNCSKRHVFGADAATGELLWTQPLPSQYQVIAATPVVCGAGVFVTAPDAGGGRLLGWPAAGAPAAELWKTPLDTCQAGVLLAGGSLYGAGYRDRRGWMRVDAATGRVLYENRDFPSGQAVSAEGRLYCLTQEGEALLLKPGPEAFEVLGRFTLVQEPKKDVWAHPVLCGGRLYLRHQDTLWCYDVKNAPAN